MKEPRRITALACNDRFVIMAAALRRTIQEAVTWKGDGPIAPDIPYTRRSFAAVVAYAHACRAHYTDHLPRKVIDRLEGQVEPMSEGALHTLMASILKVSQLDHVGAARVGVALAGRAMIDTIDALADVQAPVNIQRAIGSLSALLPVAERILTAAVTRHLSDAAPTLAGRAFTVSNFDLTAPVLLVGPEAATPIVSETALVHQIPSSTDKVAYEFLPAIFEDAVNSVLKAEGQPVPPTSELDCELDYDA